MAADDFDIVWPRFDQPGNGVRGGRLGAEIASRRDTRWDEMERVKMGDAMAIRRALPKAKGRSWECYRLPERPAP